MQKYKGSSSFQSSKYSGTSRSRYSATWQKIALFSVICAFLYVSYIMLLDQILLLSLTGVTSSALLPEKQPSSTSTTNVPQYFQTTPELWAGPTATGRAPFLVSSNDYCPFHPVECVFIDIHLLFNLGPNKSSLICPNCDFCPKFSTGDCSAYCRPRS